MTKLNIKPSEKNEKGIALLFTLVMLSMLLMLAMSFALDSMFSQKAAYNSASTSSSVIFAKAQFNQILSLVKNNQDSYDYDSSAANPRLYSVDSSSLGYSYTDMLKERLPVSGVLESSDQSLTDSPPKVKWNYIINTADNNRIVGRTAFVVIPNGKVPLDSLLDERAGTAIYPKHNEKDNTETRIGKYMSEINVRSAVSVAVANLGGDNDTKVNSMTEIMNWETDKPVSGAGFTNGKYIGFWDNFDSLFSTLDATMGFNLLDDPEKNDFKNSLSLTISKDKEAFWADINGNQSVSSTELYKRFDLTRDFDTASHTADLAFIKKYILLDNGTDYNEVSGSDDVSGTEGDGIPDQKMEKWADEDSNASSMGLPWLACFGYKDNGSGVGVEDDTLKGSFDSVRARRYQIAANFKDYCDADEDSGGNPVHRPTSDVSPTLSDASNWTTSAPVFTGNERTPYIDKIGIQVTAWQDESSTNKIPTDISNDDPVVIAMNMFMPNGERNKNKKNDGYLANDACSEYLAEAGYLTSASYLLAKNDKDKDKDKKKYAVWAVVAISPAVELINMYGSDWSENLTAVISGTVNVSTTVGGNTLENGIPFDCAIDISSTEWSGGYSRFVPITLAEKKLNGQENVSKNDLSITVEVTGLSITKVVLHNGTTAYDYTKTLSKNLPSPVTVFSGDNSSSEDSKWFGFAVHDPRQNLNEDDWLLLTTESGSTSDPSTVFSLTGSGPYYGAANAGNNVAANCTDAPNAGGTEMDFETVTDPANGNISTAYIRNAPIESPWELGFIHRGAKWQTINIKTYDKIKAIQVVDINNGTDTRQYIPGGGLYSAGDANILDQIKMTEKAESPQKINLKSRNINTLAVLFRKIRVGSVIARDTNLYVVPASHMTLESMAGLNPLKDDLDTTNEITGDPNNSSDTGIVGAIISKYETAADDEILTRASVVDQLVGTGVADAAAEELIGKTINLTKISGNVDGFYVVVLAQSIKDVGGTGGSSINISRYSNNGYLGSTSCKIGRFDVYIDGGGDYRDNIYFDEITGEQKIMFYCVRDVDGRIIIKMLEYVE